VDAPHEQHGALCKKSATALVGTVTSRLSQLTLSPILVRVAKVLDKRPPAPP